MKKLLAILVLGLLFCNTSFARIDYGCGPLKFTETAVKHFHEYLTFKKRKTGEHESTEPDYPHWTVNHVNDYAVLFVVTDGLNSSGFGIYNFPGLAPRDYPNTMGIPNGAKVFAKKNRIYWCKIKKKISRKISLEELKVTLKELGYYDGGTTTKTETKTTKCIEGNCKNGQGTYAWANGSRYVGEWKKGKQNGQGTKTWPDGGKYVGEFKDGDFHGQGTFTFANGNKYVGEHKDGSVHGQGTFTWIAGEFAGDKYVGEWKDGKRHGKGTYTYSNGDKYVGEWKGPKRHGKGIYTYASGSIEKGVWKNDIFIKEPKTTKKTKKEPKKKTSDDLVKQLKDLNELYESGVLTEEEFVKAKKKLLN